MPEAKAVWGMEGGYVGHKPFDGVSPLGETGAGMTERGSGNVQHSKWGVALVQETVHQHGRTGTHVKHAGTLARGGRGKEREGNVRPALKPTHVPRAFGLIDGIPMRLRIHTGENM